MTASDDPGVEASGRGMRLDRRRWLGLCARLAPGLAAEPVFAELEAAYGESQRAYHDAEHIVDCLAQLDWVLGAHPGAAQEPDEIEFALWLHDAIYVTRPGARGADSEAQSAQWAVRLLRAGGSLPAAIERVETMILATRHEAPAPFPDAALLVDIDLSILGRDAERFDRYEAAVRREYRWVPGPLFRSKRRAILQAFAERPSLYRTEPFRERLEAQARDNLARSLAQL